MAGRALTYAMHPLIAEELGDDFDLGQALERGLLPMAYQSHAFKHYLHSYVETYLKEEVLQEALTRNINLFARFLATAAFSQGEVINYTAIAREVGTTRQTVTNFFDILEDLLIATRLSVFNKRAKRDLISQSKFYYFDVGVFHTIRPKGPLDSIDEIHGPALETLFLQHVRAVNDYYRLGYECFFWRTRTGLEVDFILYGEKGLFAFEIKNKSRINSKDLKGLAAFRKDYPIAHCYLLYRGERAYFENEIEILPINEVLPKLKELISNG